MATVTARSWQRTGRPIRWAYVIHSPGGWEVSHYRYSTEASAIRAGERDQAIAEASLRQAAAHRPTADGRCSMVQLGHVMADDCFECWWVGDSFVSLLTKVAR
jgi:hypothetical protein